MLTETVQTDALEGKALEWAVLKAIGGSWPNSATSTWDKTGYLIDNLNIYLSSGGRKNLFIAYLDERAPSIGKDLPEAVYRAVVQSAIGSWISVPVTLLKS
ncbi:hypothetical protein ACMGGR_11510 [Erwinia sp. BNK-24-b]|uniref:hypothetical protein n=1 Tax=Erwinia TaxID=551 RepID=UPI001FEDC827|nr:hypothetical protein [Erwinia phyllosphaerae]MBV4366494.1 hypothetical protein [Erwinia phyllosphaerae]